MASFNYCLRAVAFALLLLFMAGASPVKAQVSTDSNSVNPDRIVDVWATSGRRYRIVIDEFVPLKAGASADRNAAELSGRLTSNLMMTGLFDSINPRASLEADRRSGVDANTSPEYQAWSKIGANFLIKGGVTISGSKVTMELRLFDVGMGNQMLGKRYSGSLKDSRKMINQFTNAVLEAITGTPGVFGSQIIFVTGNLSKRSIMMTEFGSDEAVQIAGHRNGPSTQPTMGPGGKTAWVHRNNNKWELLVNGKVISSGPTHLSPAFTPDGTVAAAYSEPQRTAIYTFGGRSKRTMLAGGGGINVSPTFSPDGSRMAYVSDQGGARSIYVTSSSGGTGSRLATGTDPAWSPTGEFIAFVTRETDVCIIRPDGTGFRQLTNGQGLNMRPSFSPDGRLIVFSSTRGGRSQLYVMSVNGDNPQPILPGLGMNQELPYWSPTMPKD